MDDKVKVGLLVVVMLGAVGVGVKRYRDRSMEANATWSDPERELPSASLPEPWPPASDQEYPALVLPDPQGKPVRLSDYKGKVILVEPIGMTCSACQALAGAHSLGALGNVTPQADMPSFEEIAERGGLDTSDPDFIWVHLLLYGPDAVRAPTLADGRQWAKHFGLEGKPNTVVMVADGRFQRPDTRAMIPGFHLIDTRFQLSRTVTPQEGGYEDLIHRAKSLLGQ